jgi:hypothetical protein
MVTRSHEAQWSMSGGIMGETPRLPRNVLFHPSDGV